MYEILLQAFRTLNGFLTAGIAITAFSLLLYALSFNLHDRVARSFAIILMCVVTVFVGEALSSVAQAPEQLEFWLRLQWVGIVFLPAAYLHLSDALLATTGRPSRGRRRLAVRLAYILSLCFLLALPTDLLVGPLVQDAQPAPHLQRTWLTWLFTGVYLFAMLLCWNNFRRAYQRTITSTSRRRMTYLITGALAPALGSYPYLLFGSNLAEQYPLLFWIILTIGNLLVSILLVLMAYAVAFFGVPWPDRVVKRRLFKWLMRGPVTASIVLVITTLTRRASAWFGVDLSALVPAVMVGSILALEHLITLVAPIWERWLFFGRDRADLELLQILDERLLTVGDLRQFLEAILAAVCDRLQTRRAFIATLAERRSDSLGKTFDSFGNSIMLEAPITLAVKTIAPESMPPDSSLPLDASAWEMETLVMIGGEDTFEGVDLPASILQTATRNGQAETAFTTNDIFTWGDYWLVPLYYPEHSHGRLIGLLGVAVSSPVGEPVTAQAQSEQPARDRAQLDEEQMDALAILTQRAALAIGDRYRQQQAFNSLEALAPQMDRFQRLRAASRYAGAGMLAAPDPASPDLALDHADLSPWVKDALTHYWGGPKLTENPLLDLQIVQQTARETEESPTNALRAILRRAIEHVRPEGERRFTGEWILYNILDMKFMEGRKVREIAMRLAMSEADLYRKQRVAIEAVARAIADMEQQARSEQIGEDETLPVMSTDVETGNGDQRQRKPQELQAG